MTNEELGQWFEGHFWPFYSQFCKTPFPTKWKPGTKGEALKKIITLKPSQELRDRIMDALANQVRHRKELFEVCGSMQSYTEKTAGQKLYCNRMAVTWLNQMGWEDEIPSLVEFQEEQKNTEVAQRKKCIHCDSPTHGPKFDVCTHHVSFTPEGKVLGLLTDELRAAYKNHPEWKTWTPRQHADAMGGFLRRVGGSDGTKQR